MLPYKNKHPLRSVGIPSLSGGVNLRDGLTQVNDNQLTDVKNMWFKDGMLKTRPGVINTGELPGDSTVELSDDVVVKPTDAFKEKDGIRYRLVSLYDKKAGDIYFYWIGDDRCIEASNIKTDFLKYFVIQSNNKIYCFVTKSNENKPDYKIYEYDENKWTELSDLDIYAPLIMTNCLTTIPDRHPEGFLDVDVCTGDQMESFSFISDRYRLLYSTVNKSMLRLKNGDLWGEYDEEGAHQMIYGLPFACISPEGRTFIAKITYFKEEEGRVVAEHKVTFPEGNNYKCGEKELNKDDNLCMWVTNQSIYFTTTTNEGDYASVSLKDYSENNMEVNVVADFDPANGDLEMTYNKVFDMTRAEWFGGASAGLNGGTRLFLGGNVNENEQSLVIWSDLNNPLYFPENNYAYVGNANIPVTGFGKQNDMLVIFKSSEIFATQYVQNSGITAESLINQSAVDIAANSVYFPLIQIHSSVGCDLPDTVCLCRNRLVWATKQGKVYTLVSQSQYNERNIFDISQMIERKLKGTLNEYAHAVDYDGYYMLFCGNKAFVCDYNSYGFIYAASHSKTEDANIRIPWYYWELRDISNEIYGGAFLIGGKLFIAKYVFCTGRDQSIYFCTLKETENMDNNNVIIPTSFTTKAFDFGSSAYEKHIPQVHIAFGDNGNEPINISFLTDKGEAEGETVYIPSDESSMRDSTYLKSTVIRPNVRFARHFGIKAECEGAMAVGDVSINYRIQGEVK